MNDDMLCDCLVLGCHDQGTKSHLFREKECTLKKALEALKISEAAQEQLKDIGSEASNPIPINAVNLKKSIKYKKPKAHHPTCKYCGGNHALDRRHCPAYGKICR